MKDCSEEAERAPEVHEDRPIGAVEYVVNNCVLIVVPATLVAALLFGLSHVATMVLAVAGLVFVALQGGSGPLQTRRYRRHLKRGEWEAQFQQELASFREDTARQQYLAARRHGHSPEVAGRLARGDR